MNRIIRLAPLVIVSFILGISTLAGIADAAGTATMSFSPASGSVLKGDTLTVDVYEDSDTDTVNAVQANFTYPSSLLTYSGYTSSSAFSIDAESSGSGGNVRLGRGTITPVSGSQLIATVRFTATAAGSVTLSFGSGSAVVRDTDHQTEALSYSPGSYTITEPVVPPVTPPATPPASSGGSGSSGSASSSTKPKTSAPVAVAPSKETATTQAPSLSITAIQAVNLSPHTATIQWKTSVAASSEVNYGDTTDYVLSSQNKALTTEHSLALNPNGLIANQTYHFIVKSVDAGGKQAVSVDMTFHTPAVPAATAPAKKTSTALVALTGGLAVMAIAGGALHYFRGRGGGPGPSGGSDTYGVSPLPPASGPTTPPASPSTIAAPQDALVNPPPDQIITPTTKPV